MIPRGSPTVSNEKGLFVLHFRDRPRPELLELLELLL